MSEFNTAVVSNYANIKKKFTEADEDWGQVGVKEEGE